MNIIHILFYCDNLFLEFLFLSFFSFEKVFTFDKPNKDIIYDTFFI